MCWSSLLKDFSLHEQKNPEAGTFSSWSRPSFTCFSSLSMLCHMRQSTRGLICLHPASSGTAGKECQCSGRTCKEETLWSSRVMQDSSGTHNLPTHLLILEYIGGNLLINLMFEEITTLLQLCVEISSSVLRSFSNPPMSTRSVCLILITNCDM